MSFFNKNRLQELAGIQSKNVSDEKTLKENFRSFGIVSPGTLGSFENEENYSFEEEEEKECSCPLEKEDLPGITEDKDRHVEYVEYELTEQMKVLIGKLELIKDYDNLDKAVDLLQSMKDKYSLN